jgi:hypothetical protein
MLCPVHNISYPDDEGILKMFTIMKGCVMHNNQMPTFKVKVTL